MVPRASGASRPVPVRTGLCNRGFQHSDSEARVQLESLPSFGLTLGFSTRLEFVGLDGLARVQWWTVVSMNCYELRDSGAALAT